MRKKNAGTGVSVGGSSILVIFVLLCLTTFATLSLVSANADLKLTSKTALATSEYYVADARAEELMSFVGDCAGQARFADNETDFRSKLWAMLAQNEEHIMLAENTVAYHVIINETQQLQVRLRVNYPNGDIVREQWKVVNTTDWQPDDESLNIWSGEEEDLGMFDPTKAFQ